MTVSTTYAVSGMSCQHCVDAVTGELSKLDAVEAVQVDLGSGAVTVTSTDPLADDVVRAAIDEAGYDLVDRTD
jgi:copper chaperone